MASSRTTRATIRGGRACRRPSGTRYAPRSARHAPDALPPREAPHAAVVPRVLQCREHGVRRVTLPEGLDSDEQATARGGGRGGGGRRLDGAPPVARWRPGDAGGSLGAGQTPATPPR